MDDYRVNQAVSFAWWDLPLFRCRLSGMNRCFLSVCTLAITVASSILIDQLSAQKAVSGDVPPEGVVLTELARPSYPPLGRQAQISGNVDLMLRIRQDGSIESAVVVSGHPLLAQTALESAQHSSYACRKCGETVTPFRLVYTFQLAEPKCCVATDDSKKSQPDEQIPRVTQSLNHITVIDQPVCLCDPAFEVGYKVRSLKCFYLWRCSTPRVRSYQ